MVTEQVLNCQLNSQQLPSKCHCRHHHSQQHCLLQGKMVAYLQRVRTAWLPLLRLLLPLQKAVQQALQALQIQMMTRTLQPFYVTFKTVLDQLPRPALQKVTSFPTEHGMSWLHMTAVSPTLQMTFDMYS